MPLFIQSLPKSNETLMSLQKLFFFLLGRLGGGEGPHFNSAKEKRFSFSKQMPLLWEEEGRDGAYSDPLSINLGIVE